MTCEELGSQPNWNTSILHTNSLLAAIPKRWKSKINGSAFKFQGTPCFSLVINKCITPRYNLYNWNKISSNKCFHCFNVDTLEHHLYYCPVSTKFWCEINNFLHNTISVKIHFSVCKILFGIFNYLYL